jgi:hypothetical protein
MDTAPSWFQFLFVFAFRPLGLGATWGEGYPDSG